MKKLIFSIIIIGLMSANYVKAQMPTHENAVEVKSKTIIFPLQKEDAKTVSKLRKKPAELKKYKQSVSDYNDMMKMLATKYWKYNDKAVNMPYDQAEEQVKKGNAAIVEFNNVHVPSAHYIQGQTSVVYITSGLAMEIKGKARRPLEAVFLPQFKDGVTDEIAVYGLMQMQYIMNEFYKDKNLTGFNFYKTKVKDNTKELQDQTLLVPREWLDEKITPETFGHYYPYKHEVVPYERVVKAILDKEDIGFVMIVPVPGGGGQYMFQHFLCNASNGEIYGVEYPKAAVSMMGINLSAKNKPVITEKIIGAYTKMISGK